MITALFYNLNEAIKHAIETLPEREQVILKCRLGLDGEQKQTLREVGNKLSINAERVRQIQVKATRHLRQILDW